jgi:hypothetical protein
MVTFTLSHQQGDDLALLLQVLKGAYSSTFKSKVFEKWRERLGWIGTVRGLEVTHGGNGYHPHLHVLCLADHRPSDSDLACFASWARKKYVRAVVRRGGYADELHGLNVLLDVEDGSYLDKDAGWNLSHEVAKANVKNSKGKGGRSMNRLLHESAEGDQQAGVLWSIYAAALRGQKHLVWSQGLKDRYLSGDVSDGEAAAADIDTGSRLLASLLHDEWYAVKRLGLRGEVLDVAAHGCRETLRMYLEYKGVL